MKQPLMIKSEAPSADLLGLHVAVRSELLKAKVGAYTRKDGVFIAEHHDKRAAAKPAAVAGAGTAAAPAPAAGAGAAPAPAPAPAAAAGAAGAGRAAPPQAGSRTPPAKADPRTAPAPVTEPAATDDGPDEENPKLSLSRLDSAPLASAIRTGADLNKHAKIELAKRGMDAAGSWKGFKNAPAAHGLSQADMDSAKDPDSNPLVGHFQTMHPKLLSAAASGKFDLNKHAKQEAANRGIDTNGRWVGFDKAKQVHLGEDMTKSEPAAKPMPMGWRPPSAS